jgi:hypothetical protein
MADYEIGYGRPPESRRFRPGESGNPKGRPKRRPTPLAEIITAALDDMISYQERGRTKVATCRELCLMVLVDRAVSGDLEAGELVLKIRDHAQRHGDAGLDPILVENWIADRPRQTASQKTAEFAATQDAKPVEWWRSSES